jgi:hypothetical protein
MQRANIVSLTDVGSVVAKSLSFPMPSNWQELSWCENNLDLPTIRRAFSVAGVSVREGHSHDATTIENAFEVAWNAKSKSFSKLKGELLWGTSLSLGIVGSLVGNPAAGILASLGLVVAEKLWSEPMTTAVARALRPQSFHIWDCRQRLGRPRS